MNPYEPPADDCNMLPRQRHFTIRLLLSKELHFGNLLIAFYHVMNATRPDWRFYMNISIFLLSMVCIYGNRWFREIE